MSSDSLFEKNPKIFCAATFLLELLGGEEADYRKSSWNCGHTFTCASKQFTATFKVGNKIKISSPSKTKLTFTIKTISNKRRIARTVVWALGISARCIRMAFSHFEGMGLAAFVNVWEWTYIVKKKSCWRLGQIRSEKNIQSLQESASHSCKSFFLSPFPFSLILAFATNLIREIIWFHQLR